MKHKTLKLKHTKQYKGKPCFSVFRVSCFTFHEQGSAIYLALFTLSAVLATALAVSTVAVGEYKISKEVVDSMQAIYVADSAMEYTMMEVRKNPTSSLYNSGTGVTALDANLCESQIHFVGPTFNTGSIKCIWDSHRLADR